MVLGVRDYFLMRFGDAAGLGFPIAVEHDPVDMVLGWRTARIPTVRSGGGEPHVGCRAGRVVRVEQRLDGPLAFKRTCNTRCDAVACHVGKLLVHEERRISAALAHEAGIE